MKATLPLLATRDLAAALAWHRGEAIDAAHFIGEALLLAEALPANGRPLNLCQDRYHFALGLAAALLRGQTSLMPPNALPDTLGQVPAGAAPYLLIDLMPPGGDGGLPVVQVQRPAGAAPARSVPQIPVDMEAVCLLTSGSTGAPQPHAKRWGSLVANIAAEAQALAQRLQRPSLEGLTLVATVPAQHSYGLESSVLLALLGGAAFESGRPFYPADIVQALAAVPQPRALVTTPFHLKTLLLAGVDLPPVDLLLSATAPLSPQLAAQAEAASGGRLVEIYGCTEAGQVASRRTTEGDTWTTLGELRIAASGEHFVVSGGHVSEPTVLADVLELHDSQRFRLLGRANDLIHVAGKRSSLAHLNFHLNRIEGVSDGAFWLPQEDGEDVARPVAFVVAPGLAARDIIAALRGHLEPAFVPRRVLHVAALPREATGKLTVAALRAFALQVMADPVVTIAADHPAFAGHFPGRPVLPGVVLLSLVTQALNGRLGATPRIDNAKFLAPVGPGAQLRLALREQSGGNAVAFEIWHGPLLAVRGQLSRDDA
ncbi:MAG TPA: AMP-binding protein [Rubrivivax sp.]|nr:AMP-binding protein [Rubrivivax sp.]